jgi:serine/threonine protein kinase/tetratricopeptide (TPR) repeat protein
VIGKTLAHYDIVEKIGEGGMGEVYRARDRRLNRDVAVKVLPERLQQDRDALARIDHEAKALAAVSHPNILTVFDVGSEHGIAFVVMELLRGESLESRIEHAPLPWKEAVEIAAAMAAGLHAAHARGVIHGDFKPANVILTEDGVVKIVDFGLAHVEIPAVAAPDSRAETVPMPFPGAFAGTAQYLSPEQVSGKPGDARSDLFAFGCTLYAMLTGHPPFDGDSFAEVMAAILRDPVPELGGDHPVPPALEELIHACLRKDATDRVRSARDAETALRSIAAGVASRHAPRPRSEQREPRQLIDSLAILPFVNSSSNPEIERLGDGLIGRLIDTLSTVSGLRVMALTTVSRYKGRLVDPRTVGNDLDVRAVLNTRILSPENTPTIEVELVDAYDGARLWGDRYHCDECNLLGLQDELATRITEKLEVEILRAERSRIERRPTEDEEAFRRYLHGRFYWNKRNREGLLRSIEEFELALQQDPAFPLAHAGLADAYALLGGFGYVPPREAYEKAKAEALRALELDATLAEAHCSLATVKYRFDWDWEAAGREFRLALQHNPGYATAHHWYGVYLVLMTRFEEGLAEVDHALRLDPLSLVNWTRGYVLYYMRRYDDAIEQLTSTLAIDPTFAHAYADIGLCWIQKGRVKRGIEEIQKAIDLLEPNPALLASLGYAYGKAGDPTEARKILEELLGLSRRRVVSSFSMAIVCAGLGDTDATLQWLERSFEAREDALVSLLVNPRLDPLRTDPRFENLLRRVGLPAAGNVTGP